MNHLFQRLRQLGIDNNVSFSGQELLKDCIIGFAGIHRKVFVLKQLSDIAFQSFVIDLNEVKRCTVRKQYGAIRTGELKVRKLDHYLEEMVLHFELKNGEPPVEVLFYKHSDNHVGEIAELERKARYWSAILSKLCLSLVKTA